MPNSAFLLCHKQPLINNNVSLWEIVKNTGRSYHTISKAIGYIASHQLADYEMVRKFTPEFRPDNIVEYFKILSEEKGTMSENARKLFGWSTKDYHYFLFLPEAQYFLLFHSHEKKRRKYKSNEEFERIIRTTIKKNFFNSNDITIENVSKLLNISLTLIPERGLNRLIIEERNDMLFQEINIKIDKYLLSKEEILENARIREIYSLIGKSYRWFKTNAPEIIDLINFKVKEYNEKIKINDKVIIKSDDQTIYMNINQEAALSKLDE